MYEKKTVNRYDKHPDTYVLVMLNKNVTINLCAGNTLNIMVASELIL